MNNWLAICDKKGKEKKEQSPAHKGDVLDGKMPTITGYSFFNGR